MSAIRFVVVAVIAIGIVCLSVPFVVLFIKWVLFWVDFMELVP